MTLPGVGDAYNLAADAWHHGPERVYARLAEALLSMAPVEMLGARVLDVGAGTAVAARAALARGAEMVVAADIATGMLRHRGPDVLAVGADAALLPFADSSFDLTTAGLCLGHLPEPARALTEIHRVSGAVVASAFPGESSHPAKAAIDQVMVEAGLRIPDWHRHLKDATEPAVADADALRSLGHAAGFTRVDVARLEVDSGVDSPEAIVNWRWGMAHLAGFVATLTADERDRARARAEEAVVDMAPVVIPLLVLSAS
jgi:ubiquinone/menaquinone biosynthesis C-methylase UbiE